MSCRLDYLFPMTHTYDYSKCNHSCESPVSHCAVWYSNERRDSSYGPYHVWGTIGGQIEAHESAIVTNHGAVQSLDDQFHCFSANGLSVCLVR